VRKNDTIEVTMARYCIIRACECSWTGIIV
jgi:hypothetical protein